MFAHCLFGQFFHSTQKNNFSNLQLFRVQAVSPKFQVFMPCPSHLRQIQLGHGLILHCFNEFNLKSYEFPVCVPCSYQHCLSSRERSLVEHFTGILKVRVWVPLTCWNFLLLATSFFSAKTMYRKQQQQNIRGAKEIKTNCLLDHRLWKRLSR